MTAKTIRLFLADGRPDGIIKCTMSNWVGFVYKVPRTHLKKAAKHSPLEYSGVYFLFGEEDGRDCVYIGQAGGRKNGRGVLGRIEEHYRDPKKAYWSHAVTITASEDLLGPTELSYLEHRLTLMAIDASRYRVQNSNEPNRGNVSEEIEAELEEFIEFMRLCLGVLGYPVLDAVINKGDNEVHQDPEPASPIFYLKRNKANAKAVFTSEGMVILRDSVISKTTSPSVPPSALERRQQEAEFITSDYKVTKDLLFTSPSAAAAFACGGSANGHYEWKDANGRTLKECLSQEGI